MIITNLALYKVVFMIEILVAMFLFSSKYQHRKHAYIRYVLVTIFCLAFSIFFPLFDNISYTWWYSSIMFLCLFLFASIGLSFIVDASFKKIFLIAVTSYTVQHLAYQISTILCYVFKLDSTIQGVYNDQIVELSLSVVTFLKLLVNISVYSLLYVSVFELFVSRIMDKDIVINNFTIVILSGLILLIDIIANSIIVYNDDGHNIITSFVICTYNILSCLMIIFILFFILNIKNLQNELLIKSLLLKQAENKYKDSKENVDMINIKCHDLKHQIRQLGHEGNINKETITSIENLIEIYDSSMNTHNDALDLILREKKILCQNKKINLKCYADCSKLGFINDSDLYSLFGNAIDNAIEATEKLTIDEKKNIDVIVKNFDNLVSITIANYYDGELKTDGKGNFVTSKEDKIYHGYGLMSIKSIVEKYHGDLSITTNSSIFTLSILFPFK